MEIIVNDRTFVVGMCELFRQEMKVYEVSALLPLAETACKALQLRPAKVPIEGYYAESDELKQFFLLIRALQNTERRKTNSESDMTAIRRLKEVFTCPAMGRTEESDQILPRVSSPFGQALRQLADWSIDGLSRHAQQVVNDDDAGLVAVASVTGDPVAICAARESAALSSDIELAEVDVPHFTWAVSDAVINVANKFIASLAKTTGIKLPKADAASSHSYGQAAREAEIIGRCIFIGEQSGNPYPYYHWYIDMQSQEPAVKDFWSSHIWTTDSLRQIPTNQRPLPGAQVGAPNQDNAQNSRGGVVSDRIGRRERKGLLSRLFHRSQ
jgi:hypothetical protein